MSNEPTITIEPDSAVAPAAAKAEPALGQRVASGVAWVGINTIATKGIQFVTMQLVLGWLLVPDDFGIVASVTAITTIANPSRILNVNTFLSRRPNDWQKWANSAVWLTLFTVILGAVAMLAVTPFFSARDPNPRLFAYCMALSIIASTIESLVTPFAGVLNSKMAFGFITRLWLTLLTIQSITSIVLAKLGWGPYSILVPACFVAVVRLIASYRASHVQLEARPHTELLKPMIIEGIWLSVAQFAYLAITQAGYFGLGWFHSNYDTGQYFFAFQIAVQAVFMVSSGLSAVLLPAMSHAESAERRRSLYTSCCRLLLIVTAPLVVMQTLAIEPAVKFVFADKWLPAISFAVLLSAGSLLRIVSFPSQSMFVAESRLKLYAAWMGGWAIAYFAAILIASAFGSVMTVTLTAVVFFAVFDPLTGVVAFRLCGQSLASSLATILRLHLVPLIASLVSGVAVFYLQKWIGTLSLAPKALLLLQIAACGLVMAIYAPITFVLSPQDAKQVWGVMSRMILPRIPGSARLARAIGMGTA